MRGPGGAHVESSDLSRGNTEKARPTASAGASKCSLTCCCFTFYADPRRRGGRGDKGARSPNNSLDSALGAPHRYCVCNLRFDVGGATSCCVWSEVEFCRLSSSTLPPSQVYRTDAGGSTRGHRTGSFSLLSREGNTNAPRLGSESGAPGLRVNAMRRMPRSVPIAAFSLV